MNYGRCGEKRKVNLFFTRHFRREPVPIVIIWKRATDYWSSHRRFVSTVMTISAKTVPIYTVRLYREIVPVAIIRIWPVKKNCWNVRARIFACIVIRKKMFSRMMRMKELMMLHVLNAIILMAAMINIFSFN